MAKFNEAFLDKLMNEPGMECRCGECGRFAKVYKRSLSKTTLKQLIAIYVLSGDTRRWVHIAEVVKDVNMDFNHAKYWGLVEAKPNEDNPKKKCSGFWRLTELGRNFVSGHVSVPRYTFTFGDEPVGTSAEEVFITSPTYKNFNYQELMSKEY
jgi:hypothetical protein